MSDLNEYIVFSVTTSDNREVELAVVDEFEFEKKNYAACALVEGDTINEDGLYIYRIKENADDYSFDKITNSVEYERVVKAYLEME